MTGMSMKPRAVRDVAVGLARRATVAIPLGVLAVGVVLAGTLLASTGGQLAPRPVALAAPGPMALAAPPQPAVRSGPAAPMLSPASVNAPSPVVSWTAPAAPEQALVDVAVRDNFFEPETVTVTVGVVVRWTNRGQQQHSSTSEDGYWSWGLVPGASFGLRFLSPGTYRYYCVYHRDEGMTGTVVVLGSGPLPTPTIGPGPAPGVDAETIVYDYFADEATGTRTDLFLVQPDGSSVRPLTNTPNLAEAQPSWSPDRRRVAYTASTHDTPNAAWGLWVLDVATGQRQQITDGPENYEPDWRPDGSLLVFTNIGRTGGVPTSSEIAVITPDGYYYRPLARVVSTSYGMVNPTWSPDGQRIAFSLSSNEAGGELYVMNADGSNVHRVLAHPGWDDIDPEWSPDGRYLAFSSGLVDPEATRHDIWLLDMTTGLAGTVAQEPTWDLRRPAWSSEGGRIVFTAQFQTEPARWALYVVPATGGAVTGPLALGVEPDWGSGAVLPPATLLPPPTGTPPEPPTPPAFPTIPPPEPTDPGPPPTFPPPEPTSTPGLPEATATPSATSSSVVRGLIYLAITWKP